MSEQILVGRLKDPYTVETEDGETQRLPAWHKRAMWSYLRLVHGRKIDDKIKKQVKKGKTVPDVFFDLFKPADRPLQFIVSSGIMKAVATTKHLLIPPETVYMTAREILGVPLSSVEGLDGVQAFIQEFAELKEAGLKVGFQIHGGTITTRFAIRVGSYLRVEMCLNPVSWLGVSGLRRFGFGVGSYERVLRIQKITELEPRLKTAIQRAIENKDNVFQRVERAKGVSVSADEMRIITSAMGLSYGLGHKTIKQVFDRWQEEDKTQWGMAMAGSWVAKHGDFRKTPEGQYYNVPQKLSTISGATLLIDDMKTAEQKSLEWLRQHIKSGRLQKVEELLGKLHNPFFLSSKQNQRSNNEG